MKYLALVLSSMMLVACGGGSGGGVDAPASPTGPVASTLSFPLKSAFNTWIANGASINLVANGTSATEATNGLCSGTLTKNNAPAVSGTTFLGASALSSVGVVTMTWTNCTPALNSSTGTNYYDTNYLPIGSASQSGSVGVYAGTFNIPNSVKVGDVGISGTENYYTDNTRTVADGHRDISFVVEPETTTSAVVNIISKYYNPYIALNLVKDGKLRLTTQERYRISGVGGLIMISFDMQTFDTGFRMTTDPSNAHHFVFNQSK